MGAIKSRKRLFTENFLIYGLGGIISKVIPLIMVPIITRLMPDSSYYGISDLANTVISFFSAIALLGMYDAMFRMFFEKDDLGYKKDICSSAFTFTLILSVFVSVLMCIFQEPISRLFFSDPQYGYLVMISAISVLVGTTNSIISAPTRMQNKRGTYLIMNTVSPIISYAISIPLLLNGYYLIALPVASACSSVITEISFGIINHEWFSLKRTNWHYVWEMLKIALPLAPNFLIYWIFNSSDRVMIANLLSTSESGVYAVAAKFGHLSQLIYTAFAGGWQYFAFSVMKDKDNETVVSKVFEVLLIASLTTTMMGTAIAKWGVKILFTEEYWSSYLCIPYLYLSPLLLMLFQIGSNQFLVIKKTWPNIVILGVGAALNVALNFVLIPVIGIEGASLATFIGYFVSIVIMAIALKKMKLMYIRTKTLIYSAMFLVGFGVMRIFDIAKWYVNLIVLVLFLALTILLYWKDYSKYLKHHRKPKEVIASGEESQLPDKPQEKEVENKAMELKEKTEEQKTDNIAGGGVNNSLKPRNSSIELLKLITMFLIVVDHIDQTLADVHCKAPFTFGLTTTDPTQFTVTLLMFLGIIADDIFWICSCWFLVDSDKVNKKKILQMMMDVWVISVLGLIVGLVLSKGQLDMKTILKSLFPNILCTDWYISCYILLYALHPLLNKIIHSLDQKKLLSFTLVLTLLYIVLGTVGGGLGGNWYFSSELIVWIVIYFLVAYLKLYCPKLIDKKSLNWTGLVIGFVGLLALLFLTNFLGLHFSAFKDKLMHWWGIQNVFILLFSLSLFNLVRQIHFENKVINYLSRQSLLIYLIHGNICVEAYVYTWMLNYIYDTFTYQYIIGWVWLCGLGVFVLATLISCLYNVTLQRLTKKLVGPCYNLLAKCYHAIQNKILCLS